MDYEKAMQDWRKSIAELAHKQIIQAEATSAQADRISKLNAEAAEFRQATERNFVRITDLQARSEQTLARWRQT